MKRLATTLTGQRPGPVTGVRKSTRALFEQREIPDPPFARRPVRPASPIAQESARV